MEDLKMESLKIIGPAKELFDSFYKVKEEIGCHVFPDGKNPHFGNDYITLDALIKKSNFRVDKHHDSWKKCWVIPFKDINESL